jgi:secreted trypsin-like serine protease
MSRTIDGLWDIVGITSYGKGCGRLNELGVYTRVSMYRNWIDMTMNSLDDYSSRSLNKPNNIFFNSARHSSIHFFLLFSFLVIQINKI